MNKLITQKTQEIGFALLRVAAHIRRYELRKTFERLTYFLIENISYGNAEVSINTIETIRNFVVLSKNLYEIEVINAKILDRELEHLGNQVRRFIGNTELPDLETLFTKKIKVEKVPQEIVIPDEEVVNTAIEYGNAAIINKESNNTAIENQESDNTAMRQEKIFSLINTAQDKRLPLKEITSSFPGVSDRTIRYDLKKLAEDGRIMRQGSGGPSNYYTVRNVEQMSVINL